jgi:hypothetical protein
VVDFLIYNKFRRRHSEIKNEKETIFGELVEKSFSNEFNKAGVYVQKENV